MAAPADLIPELRQRLERVAQPDRAPAMAAYLRGRSAFLGVAAAERKRASRPFVAAGRTATADQLLDAADVCWAQPEREFQYAAIDLLRRWNAALLPDSLSHIELLIRDKSWWDTVDAIAANVVGPLVERFPELVEAMEEWIDDSDLWIARAAVLHQLTYGSDTDADRLFRAVDRRAGDSDFFMRKACGWALRQYARHDPAAVLAFVTDRGDRLSGLTRREALKHL
jgi:3-methyladenine DNA glycosylase AlkD